MSKNTLNNNDLTGLLGENIAAGVLEREGYSIICRNYRKKYGEIDIIAEREGVVCFFEVKTSEYGSNHEYIPHMRVTPTKIRRLRRVVGVFIEEFPKLFPSQYLKIQKISGTRILTAQDISFSFGILSVQLDLERGMFKLTFLKDVVI